MKIWDMYILEKWMNLNVDFVIYISLALKTLVVVSILNWWAKYVLSGTIWQFA
jgi:hypothetical protein